jgi:small conductance mechanosensitive channel
LLEKDPAFARKIIGPFEYPGVQELGSSAVVLRMVAKTLPQDGAVVLRELRRRVKKAFDEAGIEIPFPHVKVVRDREGVA